MIHKQDKDVTHRTSYIDPTPDHLKDCLVPNTEDSLPPLSEKSRGTGGVDKIECSGRLVPVMKNTTKKQRTFTFDQMVKLLEGEFTMKFDGKSFTPQSNEEFEKKIGLEPEEGETFLQRMCFQGFISERTLGRLYLLSYQICDY
jgi:hypothetical protein